MKQSTPFPYNVLTGSIQVQLEEETENEFIYHIDFPDWFKNEEEYINNSRCIDLAVEINCSSTIYREVFKTNQIELTFPISKDDVAIRYEIDVLAIANDEMEWMGKIINKGGPVAHFGRYLFDIDKRSKGIIEFTGDPNSKELKILNSDHTIMIELPSEKFEYIKRKQYNKLMKSVLASNFAQIALLESCKEIKQESSRSHLNWFEALLQEWRKYNNDKEYPGNDDHLPFVKYLLKNPSLKLLDTFKKYDENINTHE